MYVWVTSYDRRRFELRDTATGQVLEAFVDPGQDNSDLRGVSTAPLEPELVQAFRSGDHDTLNRAFGALDRASAHNLAQTGSPATVAGTQPTVRQAPGVGGGQGQQAGNTYVRMEPADILAQVGRIDTAQQYQTALNRLGQSEYELRQKMIAAGQQPRRATAILEDDAMTDGGPPVGHGERCICDRCHELRRAARPADDGCPGCAERNATIAAREATIAGLLRRDVEIQAERDLAWELMTAKGSTAPLVCAVTAWRELHNRKPDDEGYRQIYRGELAKCAQRNETAAGEGMTLLRMTGLITERVDPDDHSDHPRFQQHVATDYYAGLKRLRDHCRAANQDYAERRGRPKQDPAQPNFIRPCPEGADHPIDAVCRVDGTVVQRDLRVTPAGEGADTGQANSFRPGSAHARRTNTSRPFVNEKYSPEAASEKNSPAATPDEGAPAAAWWATFRDGAPRTTFRRETPPGRPPRAGAGAADAAGGT